MFYLNKILYFFLILFLLIGILGFFINSNPSNQIIKKPYLPFLEIGDLVFRAGIGSESFLIENLSQSPYSHIAMVVKTSPTILIHATTDDDKNAKNQVILSSMDDFLKLSHKIAIKRLKFDEKTKQKIVAKDLEHLGRKFIISTDKDAFYCTTFLEQSINSIIPFHLQYTLIKAPFNEGLYLFPQTFFENNQSVLIYESQNF
ncbi:YiiX/YebB-like N1pC/P60 family cysteine hydrolase [Campylobacter jejuni]